MLYKKLCAISLTAYAFLTSQTFGATYYVSSNSGDDYAYTGSNINLNIYCNEEDIHNGYQFNCGNAQNCYFHCDEKKCAEQATIRAPNSDNLYVDVGSNGQECFKDAHIYAPHNGSAYFTMSALKGFKEMNVYSGTHTKEIIIHCSSPKTDKDECKEMNVDATTADYLKITVADGIEFEEATIKCPVDSSYNGPDPAPCIIDATDGIIATLSIIAPDGVPKGVYVTGTATKDANVQVTCSNVDLLNGNMDGVSTFPFNTNSGCWWTNNPTSDPTTDPTQNPTPSPTINPSLSPTKSPTTSNPTQYPTTTDPTINPSKTPTNYPTLNPSNNPTITPTTSNPTTSPTPSPTVNPTQNPTDLPSLNPSINPSISPTTTAPTWKPTRSPLIAGQTHNPTLSPSSSPTLTPPTTSPSPRPTTVKVLSVEDTTTTFTTSSNERHTTTTNVSSHTVVRLNETSENTSASTWDAIIDVILIILLAVIVCLCIFLILFVRKKQKAQNIEIMRNAIKAEHLPIADDGNKALTVPKRYGKHNKNVSVKSMSCKHMIEGIPPLSHNGEADVVGSSFGTAVSNALNLVDNYNKDMFIVENQVNINGNVNVAVMPHIDDSDDSTDSETQQMVIPEPVLPVDEHINITAGGDGNNFIKDDEESSSDDDSIDNEQYVTTTKETPLSPKVMNINSSLMENNNINQMNEMRIPSINEYRKQLSMAKYDDCVVGDDEMTTKKMSNKGIGSDAQSSYHSSNQSMAQGNVEQIIEGNIDENNNKYIDIDKMIQKDVFSTNKGALNDANNEQFKQKINDNVVQQQMIMDDIFNAINGNNEIEPKPKPIIVEKGKPLMYDDHDTDYIDIDELIENRQNTKGAISPVMDEQFKQNINNNIMQEQVMMDDIFNEINDGNHDENISSVNPEDFDKMISDNLIGQQLIMDDIINEMNHGNHDDDDDDDDDEEDIVDMEMENYMETPQ